MSGVSACIIVRDEETMLPECLASLAAWVDELCVVDTGSTDATVSIARAYGARVLQTGWQDDFSHARNVSLAMATQPWILVIDADERLQPSTGAALRRAISTAPIEQLAFLVAREDLQENGTHEDVALVRLFRNHPQIRFTRPVHESIMEALLLLNRRPLVDSGVKLSHLGYLPAVLRQRDKHTRNLAILHERFRVAPDDLYNAYKFAVTLPATALPEKLSVFAQAASLMERLSASERAERPFLARLCDAYAASLASAGALSQAIALADHGRALFPESADLLYRRGELARLVGNLNAAAALIEHALVLGKSVCGVRADRSYELAVRGWVSLLAIAHDGGAIALPVRDAAARDVAVRCAELRVLVQRAQPAEAANGLAALLESDFHNDCVKLVAGELAWQLRDFNTADAMWSMTRESSEAGHRAHTWLRLLALARGEQPTFPEPLRDVADCALARLIEELAPDPSGARPPLRLDPAFSESAQPAWRARWCSALRHAMRNDLADRAR